ncbi:MAG TPA: hypothetical protein VLD86_01935, partial [Ilumatobacteraceae bacterium]|nr:hypothetical protein [Ilumatobacteraceae bacterium]
MTAYPGFSTARMDAIFALESRVAAMTKVEAAVAAAQGDAGDIPAAVAAEIVAACVEPVDTGVLDRGWEAGTPLIPLLDALRQRLPEPAHPFLHRGLTTQD